MNRVELNNMLINVGNNHHRINWGGCACVAVMIADNLPDYIETRICTPGDINLDEARNNIDNPMLKENWYGSDVRFAHVWIEAKINGEWLALDSTGTQDVQDMYDRWGSAADGSFTLDEMRSMAAQLTWSSTFNRDQLPSMQRMIEDGFAGLAE